MKKSASRELKAQLALLLVCVIWGGTFPLVRQAVSTMSPAWFVFVRFGFAVMMFLPFVLLRVTSRRINVRTIFMGLGLGVVLWASYFTQTIGLQTVNAGRAAFITGTNVMMVPLLAPLFCSGRSNYLDYGAAFLTVVGLILLTDPTMTGLAVGDVWVLMCALAYAIYILLLQKVLNMKNVDKTFLAFFQVLGVMVMSVWLLPFEDIEKVSFGKQMWMIVIYCSLFATVGTFWLQTQFQAYTTPQRAALLFATEPIFAAIFGFILLGERMALPGYVGSAIILFSIVGSELVKNRKKKNQTAILI